MNEFLDYYEKVKKDIALELDNFNKYLLKNNDNELVRFAKDEFIRMNADGKMIRGFLIYLGFNAFNDGKDASYAIPLAASYEAFETAILIHDDIIDNAVIRRGKPTTTVSYNEKYNDENIADSMAICIGDLGFFNVNKYLLEKYKNDHNLLAVLNLYNDIVINTIEGQFIDVELPVKNKMGNLIDVEKDVFDIYKNKTAWYTIIGPFKLGLALVGNTSDEYDSFLENIGISFQIKDDILGIFGDSKIMGKSTNSDIAEFKQTILFAYICDYKKEYLDKLLEYYGKELNQEEVTNVQNIFKDSGALDYAKNKLDELLSEAKKEINSSTLPDLTKKLLLGLTEYIETREK